MNHLRRIATGLVAAAALGGCQTLTDLGLRDAQGGQPEVKVQAMPSAAEQIAEGRRLLDLDRYGVALVAFRAASIDPAHAPAAHNGIAVAYAGLGRLDLADRYFRLAIAGDPAEQRYADNLRRLEAEVEGRRARLNERASAERAQSARAALAGSASSASPGRVPHSGISVQSGGSGRLVRTSTREVSLVSAPALVTAPAGAAVLRAALARRLDRTQPASRGL